MTRKANDKRFDSLVQLLSDLNAWDLWISAIASVIFLVVVVQDREDFQGSTAAIATAVTFGMVIVTVALTGSRWLADRMKEEYGEAIRIIDPDESNAQRPYYIVAWLGFLTSAWGVLGLVIEAELDRSYRIGYYAVLLWLGSWSLLGIASLIRITGRHQRRQARLLALKEELEAKAREGQEQQRQD